MESEEAKDGMFKKKNKRVRIGIAACALTVVAVVIIVVVEIVVFKNNEKQDRAKILSIESSGLHDNHVSVTVHYEGSENCFSEWLLYQYLSNFPLRKAGTKQKIEDGVIETALRIDVRQIASTLLRIYCGDFSTVLNFVDGELKKTARVENDIADSSDYTFTLTKVEKDLDTDNIKLVIRMNNPVNDTKGSVDFGMFVDGLNTSTTPNTLFEYLYSSNGDENALLKLKELPLDRKPQVEIVVSSQFAKFGGLITPFVVKRIDRGFVLSISQGFNFPLKSTETEEVVPTNSFGIFRTDSEVDNLEIFSDEHSFLCFVIGNPIPSVELFVTYQNGTQSGLHPVTNTGIDYLFYSYITIHKDQFENGGKFTCRATLNQETQTQEITFLFRNFEQCTIDRTRTGLISQTNESDTVRCTASGIPSPNVALDLYHSGGPDLLLTGKFQVSNTTIDHTISVNLTISPPNPDIHTLVCECRQGLLFGPNRNGTQEIVLYPGRQNNYTLYDELFSYWDSMP